MTEPRPEPTEAEIERAVENMVRLLLPGLREVARVRHGGVTIILQAGKPKIWRVETVPPDFDLYGVAGPLNQQSW